MSGACGFTPEQREWLAKEAFRARRPVWVPGLRRRLTTCCRFRVRWGDARASGLREAVLGAAGGGPA